MEMEIKVGAMEASMIEPEVVLRIRALAGCHWGTRRIAAELGISRKAVKRYLGGAEAHVQQRPKARCLDEEGVRLAQELFKGAAERNAVVVKDLLVDKGYDVSERTVQRSLVSTRREQRAADVATARYETAPGEQMQIDFGEKRVVIAGVVVVVHMMAAVLGYSRRIFVKAFLAERAEDWREGIACAFRYFGGVAEILLVDNSRCLVKGRDVDTAAVIFQPGLVALCKDFNCTPRACAPYRARTKGKVESGVKYVKRNGLAGREFTSFAALEAHLSAWSAKADQRVHGTTNETPLARFERERPALRALPSLAIRARERRHHRRVSNDAFVDLDTVRYSVPVELVGAMLDVDVGEARVRVYDGASLVADHQRSFEPNTRVIDKAHHAPLWRGAGLAVEAVPGTRPLGELEAMGRSLSDYAKLIEELPRPRSAGLPPRDRRGPEAGPSSMRESNEEQIGGAA